MLALNPPPMLAGREMQQLQQLHSYLFVISDQLNQALNNLTEENFAPEVKTALEGQGETNEKIKEEQKRSYGELKSLIVKTADTVRSEMDILETDLKSNYVAVSEFGTFQENVNTRIEQTAAGTTTAINQIASVKGDVDLNGSAMTEYITKTAGYIRQGIVGYKGADPIIGIAIGQNLTVTGKKETINGKEYEEIDTRKNMSIWTTEKLSFFVDGTEAAYLSNNSLNITNLQKITVGSVSLVVQPNGSISLL